MTISIQDDKDHKDAGSGSLHEAGIDLAEDELRQAGSLKWSLLRVASAA